MEIECIVVKFAFESHTDAAADTEHTSGNVFGNSRARLVVFFGNDQRMTVVDRTEVEKGDYQIILINFGGGDLVVDYFAEDTVIHN
jgi:hypothetical protein